MPAIFRHRNLRTLIRAIFNLFSMLFCAKFTSRLAAVCHPNSIMARFMSVSDFKDRTDRRKSLNALCDYVEIVSY